MIVRLRRIKVDQQVIVFGIFVLLFAAFAAFLPGFLSTQNLLNLVRNVSVLGILGLGMAIVVIGRGIDLSIIAVLAVPTALVLKMLQGGSGLLSALAVGFGLAIVTAVINAVLIAYAEIPSLFVTLAIGIVLSGVGQSGMFDYEIVEMPPQVTSLNFLGSGEIFGVPYPIITFAACVVVAGLFMRRTRWGQFIYAIGDNPSTARTTGISTRLLVILQYVLTALIAVVAGLVIATSVGNMNTRVFNSNMVYDVILVVVLGGIGLSGGRGGVLNVVVGTLLMGTLVNGMTILSLSTTVQDLVKGFILLVAITIDTILNPRNEETAQQGDI